MKKFSQISTISLLPVLLTLVLISCKPDISLKDDQLIFSKFYGGQLSEAAAGFTRTQEGEYIIAGSSQSFSNGGWDIFVLKTDRNGNELWRKNVGGLGNEFASDIIFIQDGSFIVAGQIEDTDGSSDLWLLHFDSNGDTLWSRTFGETNKNEVSRALIRTNDGGLAILGEQTQSENPPSDLFLVKTDFFGNEQWSNSYGFNGEEQASALIQDEEGNYFLLGNTNRSGEMKMLLTKADVQGNELWFRNYGPGGEVRATSWNWVGGDLYLSGFVNSSGNLFSLLIKLDANFNEKWTFSGPQGSAASSTGMLPEGNLYLGGVQAGVISENTDLYIEIINGAGTAIGGRQVSFGGLNSAELVRTSQVDGEGNITFLGTSSFEDNPMLWLFKIDPDAN